MSFASKKTDSQKKLDLAKTQPLSKGSSLNRLSSPLSDTHKSRISVTGGFSARQEEPFEQIRTGEENGSNERVLKLQDRLTSLEEVVSKIEIQQDTMRPLLKLSEHFPAVQKLDATLKTQTKKNNEIDEKLLQQESSIKEIKNDTAALNKRINEAVAEEAKDRNIAIKNIQKILSESENKQNNQSIELRMEIKGAEVRLKEELIALTTDVDNKAEAHKEFLMDHIQKTEKSLTNKIESERSYAKQIEEKYLKSDSSYEKRLGHLESTAGPLLDSLASRRKVDFEDMQTWFMAEMDKRMEVSVSTMKALYEEKFKSLSFQYGQTVKTLRSEVDELKEALESIKNSSNKNTAEVNEDTNTIEGRIWRGNDSIKQMMDELEAFSLQSSKEINDKIEKLQRGFQDLVGSLQSNIDEVKLKQANGEDITEYSKMSIVQFDDSTNSQKEELNFIKRDIENRQNRCTLDLYKISEMLGVNDDLKRQASKNQNSPASKKGLLKKEFTRLERYREYFETFKKHLTLTNNYLTKEVQVIENRMVTTRAVMIKEIDPSYINKFLETAKTLRATTYLPKLSTNALDSKSLVIGGNPTKPVVTSRKGEHIDYDEDLEESSVTAFYKDSSSPIVEERKHK